MVLDGLFFFIFFNYAQIFDESLLFYLASDLNWYLCIIVIFSSGMPIISSKFANKISIKLVAISGLLSTFLGFILMRFDDPSSRYFSFKKISNIGIIIFYLFQSLTTVTCFHIIQENLYKVQDSFESAFKLGSFY